MDKYKDKVEEVNILYRIFDIFLGIFCLSFSIIVFYLKGFQWYHYVTIPAVVILIVRGMSLKVRKYIS